MSTFQMIHPTPRRATTLQLPQTCFNIGVTGGIGSGKSTVCRLFGTDRFGTINLDTISHEITATNGQAIEPLRQTFGQNIIGVDGALDRSQMRQLVFNNPQAKQELESILHPIIQKVALDQATALSQTQPTAVLYDIPLLAESHTWQSMLDWIIVVDCSRQTQIARVLKRNPHLSIETIEQIIDQQASPADRLAIADAIIDNNTTWNTHTDQSNQEPIIDLHLKEQVNILKGYITRWLPKQ